MVARSNPTSEITAATAQRNSLTRRSLRFCCGMRRGVKDECDITFMLCILRCGLEGAICQQNLWDAYYKRRMEAWAMHSAPHDLPAVSALAANAISQRYRYCGWAYRSAGIKSTLIQQNLDPSVFGKAHLVSTGDPAIEDRHRYGVDGQNMEQNRVG